MALTEEKLIHVPGLLSRNVRLQSGVKAHYVTSGETGPNVILLHGGIPGSSGTAGFRFMAPFLGAQGFRVYCPDMPAFGLTDDPYGHYRYGQGAFVDFIHEFANALALDEFHLAGNSMGCQNTANYALAHPDRVLSYALIAGNIGDIVPRRAMRELDKRKPTDVPSAGYDGSAEGMRRIMKHIVMDPDTITDELVEMRTHAAQRNWDAYQEQMGLFLNEDRPEDRVRLTTKGRLNELDIPGICLFGLEDVMYVPEAAHLQEDALPKVQFFYPEDTGHQGQTDQPELHNQVFLEFFRDGKVSWPTAQRAGISTRRAPIPHLVSTGNPDVKEEAHA